MLSKQTLEKMIALRLHTMAQSCQRLLEIAEERYRNGSMIIASQLPIANWYDVFPDPTIADACLDRILHKSYRIEMKGCNMRKKKSTIRDEKENPLVVSNEL